MIERELEFKGFKAVSAGRALSRICWIWFGKFTKPLLYILNSKEKINDFRCAVPKSSLVLVNFPKLFSDTLTFQFRDQLVKHNC